MVNIKPTIEIYDSKGDLSKAYNKAINKMIDQTFDVDLEQFDFDEVAKGKCKEFDDLVTKLCKQSGLGSADIYSMLINRFEAEYNLYLFDIYGLDELEESKKTTKKSPKESLDEWTTNTLLGELKTLKFYIDDFRDLPSKRNAKDVIRHAENVRDFCESVIYELTEAIENDEV